MTIRDEQTIIQATKDWIESFVIALNLCPFAKREMINNRVRFCVSKATTTEIALAEFVKELDLLNHETAIETSFLIFPFFLQDFSDYLDFSYLVESCMPQDIYQIATFHPQYLFAGEAKESVSHYTNRSPYPMLHILREDSVDKAVDWYGDTEKIPLANMQRLSELGLDNIKKILASFMKKSR